MKCVRVSGIVWHLFQLYYYEDRVIVQFINEELAPYYAGDRTLDDAIKILNDRVTKYVNEM